MGAPSAAPLVTTQLLRDFQPEDGIFLNAVRFK